MATSLQSLPIEIRQKIYYLVLVEPDDIAIKVYKVRTEGIPLGVVRHPHNRNIQHRGKVYVRESRSWDPVVSSNAELLRTSKQIQADAAPIFFGMNKFSFQTTTALDRFLNQIGGMKAHIRHVSLPEIAFFRRRFSRPQLAVHRSLKALIAARDLRSLEISHYYFCIGHPTWKEIPYCEVNRDVEQLVKHCKPLLMSLKSSYEAKNLAQNFLDVINIQAPYTGDDWDRHCGSPKDTTHGIVAHFKQELTALLDSPQG